MKILVVHEASRDLELVHLAVESAGYEAVCSNSCAQARALATSETPQALLVSARLIERPESGFEELVKVDAIREVPVIVVLDGHWQGRVAELVARNGTDDFIQSPFSPHTLRTCLEAALARNARRRVELKTALREHAWLETMCKASELVSQARSLDESFTEVANRLRDVLPIDRFVIAQERGEKAVLNIIEPCTGPGPAMHYTLTLSEDEACPNRLGHARRGCLTCDGVGDRPRRLSANMNSCVCFPLYDGELQLGALSLSSHQPHAFDPASLPYLESLALQVAHTVANIRRYQQAKSDADRLATIVREVHHRIKNNLQGVIGLLDRHREEQPALAPVLTRAVSQLHAVAEVHNLLSHHTRETVRLRELVDGVCRAATTLCPHRIDPESTPTAESLTVSASEAVPIALVLNELIQNAINHGYPEGRHGTIRVTLAATPGGARLQVLDDGIGPSPGLDSDSGAGFGVGLNLVRALLPAKGAGFRLTRRDGWTVAEVELNLASEIFPAGSSDISGLTA